MRIWHRLAGRIGITGLFFILVCAGTSDLLLARPPDQVTVVSVAPIRPPVPAYMDLVRNFDYNSKAPLEIRERLIGETDSLKHIEISYANPRRWRVISELIEPSGSGPYPGIIYLCSNQPDREAFLDEARCLAQAGAVVLLIDSSVRLPDTNAIRQSGDNLNIQTVIDIRRAIDWLSTRPEIDARRIGFMGQDECANLGGIIAGVEKRIKTLILIFTNSRPSMGADNTPNAFLDGLNYIGYAAPATLLFQNSGQNVPASSENALVCFQAASQPKTLNWYATNPLTDSQARTDRFNWLCRQLGMCTTP